MEWDWFIFLWLEKNVTVKILWPEYDRFEVYTRYDREYRQLVKIIQKFLISDKNPESTNMNRDSFLVLQAPDLDIVSGFLRKNLVKSGKDKKFVDAQIVRITVFIIP